MIFDTHAHYDDEAFAEDQQELLESFPANDIAYAINVGADMSSSRRTCILVQKYPFLYGAVGVHPDQAKELNDSKLEELREMTQNPKIVAIGEIGLDYYWNSSEREVQREWFIHQLRLAAECDLPVIIHSREAAWDTMKILKEETANPKKGVIHCYSYSLEQAMEYVDMGYFIGIGGVVTFKNAKKLKEVAAKIPLSRMVLETDAPYLSPVPNRGKRNSSLNLPYIAREIAAIRGISYEEVIEETFQNGKMLYHLKEN